MSLPICFWDVCACCVGLSLQLLPRQVYVCDCTACTCSLSGKWDSESAPLLLLLPVSYLWPQWIMLDTLNHSLQLSPWCYTDCFEITSSLCALGLNFWPIPVVDFMLIVKQVVSITFPLICLPKTCNIEILSEESLPCLISAPWGAASDTIK